MARYYRHYSRKGRKGRTISLTDALPSYFDKKDTNGGMLLVQLWNAWDDLMGEMAHVARPLGHRGRKLILAAEDPMVMQEAQFLAPMILEKINGYLEQDFFDKVVFELLNGRTPLDGYTRPEAEKPPRKLKKPNELGALNEKLDPNSPLGKCYRAYQRMFED